VKRPKKKREVRIIRERHRHGGPKQGHAWAARQAAKHTNRGRSVSQRKMPKKKNKMFA